jgi:hypothetical protein
MLKAEWSKMRERQTKRALFNAAISADEKLERGSVINAMEAAILRAVSRAIEKNRGFNIAGGR